MDAFSPIAFLSSTFYFPFFLMHPNQNTTTIVTIITRKRLNIYRAVGRWMYLISKACPYVTLMTSKVILHSMENIMFFLYNVSLHSIKSVHKRVHLVLHPHGISPTFLKLDTWSPGAVFIPNISTKGINQIKKGKL